MTMMTDDVTRKLDRAEAALSRARADHVRERSLRTFSSAHRALVVRDRAAERFSAVHAYDDLDDEIDDGYVDDERPW